MSSSKRPWYKWYPKDFVSDEKVQCLSPIAELVYRRALDVMWQANDGLLPSNCLKLANAIGKGLDNKSFESAWGEIQSEGFELFKTSECGKWVYSKRLNEQMKAIKNISKKRSAAGKKGGKQKPSKKESNAYQKLPFCRIDSDSDSDSELLRSDQGSAPSGQPSTDRSKKSNHYSVKVGRYLKEIEKCCEILSKIPQPKNKRPFNPYEAVTLSTNQNGHPLAIRDTIKYMSENWDEIENPWGWYLKVFDQKNAKYNEQDSIENSQAFKHFEPSDVENFKSLWQKAIVFNEGA